ncbi:unnamed protein product [Pedinophyceae sp. YPF-701]|nr:unnamed protein product [Pedinophyceae sp. YPF-701]
MSPRLISSTMRIAGSWTRMARSHLPERAVDNLTAAGLEALPEMQGQDLLKFLWAAARLEGPISAAQATLAASLLREKLALMPLRDAYMAIGALAKLGHVPDQTVVRLFDECARAEVELGDELHRPDVALLYDVLRIAEARARGHRALGTSNAFAEAPDDRVSLVARMTDPGAALAARAREIGNSPDRWRSATQDPVNLFHRAHTPAEVLGLALDFGVLTEAENGGIVPPTAPHSKEAARVANAALSRLGAVAVLASPSDAAALAPCIHGLLDTLSLAPAASAATAGPVRAKDSHEGGAPPQESITHLIACLRLAQIAPEGTVTAALVDRIMEQVRDAARAGALSVRDFSTALESAAHFSQLGFLGPNTAGRGAVTALREALVTEARHQLERPRRTANFGVVSVPWRNAVAVNVMAAAMDRHASDRELLDAVTLSVDLIGGVFPKYHPLLWGAFEERTQGDASAMIQHIEDLPERARRVLLACKSTADDRAALEAHGGAFADAVAAFPRLDTIEAVMRVLASADGDPAVPTGFLAAGLCRAADVLAWDALSVHAMWRPRLDAVLAQLVDRIDELSPAQLPSLLRAFRIYNAPGGLMADPQLLAALGDAAIAALPVMTPHNMASTLMYLGRLQYAVPRAYQAAAGGEIVAAVPALGIAEAARLLTGAAAIGAVPSQEQFFDALDAVAWPQGMKSRMQSFARALSVSDQQRLARAVAAVRSRHKRYDGRPEEPYGRSERLATAVERWEDVAALKFDAAIKTRKLISCSQTIAELQRRTKLVFGDDMDPMLVVAVASAMTASLRELKGPLLAGARRPAPLARKAAKNAQAPGSAGIPASFFGLVNRTLHAANSVAWALSPGNVVSVVTMAGRVARLPPPSSLDPPQRARTVIGERVPPSYVDFSREGTRTVLLPPRLTEALEASLRHLPHLQLGHALAALDNLQHEATPEFLDELRAAFVANVPTHSDALELCKDFGNFGRYLHANGQQADVDAFRATLDRVHALTEGRGARDFHRVLHEGLGAHLRGAVGWAVEAMAQRGEEVPREHRRFVDAVLGVGGPPRRAQRGGESAAGSPGVSADADFGHVGGAGGAQYGALVGALARYEDFMSAAGSTGMRHDAWREEHGDLTRAVRAAVEGAPASAWDELPFAQLACRIAQRFGEDYVKAGEASSVTTQGALCGVREPLMGAVVRALTGPAAGQLAEKEVRHALRGAARLGGKLGGAEVAERIRGLVEGMAQEAGGEDYKVLENLIATVEATAQLGVLSRDVWARATELAANAWDGKGRTGTSMYRVRAGRLLQAWDDMYAEQSGTSMASLAMRSITGESAPAACAQEAIAAVARAGLSETAQAYIRQLFLDETNGCLAKGQQQMRMATALTQVTSYADLEKLLSQDDHLLSPRASMAAVQALWRITAADAAGAPPADLTRSVALRVCRDADSFSTKDLFHLWHPLGALARDGHIHFRPSADGHAADDPARSVAAAEWRVLRNRTVEHASGAPSMLSLLLTLYGMDNAGVLDEHALTRLVEALAQGARTRTEAPHRMSATDRRRIWDLVTTRLKPGEMSVGARQWVRLCRPGAVRGAGGGAERAAVGAEGRGEEAEAE